LTTIDYISEDFVEASLNWTDGEGARDTGHDGGETFCKSFATTGLYGSILTLLSTTLELAHTN
jgi:NADPH2:quinone reductase